MFRSYNSAETIKRSWRRYEAARTMTFGMLAYFQIYQEYKIQGNGSGQMLFKSPPYLRAENVGKKGGFLNGHITEFGLFS